MITDHMRLCAKPMMSLLVLQPNLVKHLPYFSDLYKHIIHNRDAMFAYFDAQIDEHRQRLERDRTTDPKDYVDAYLLEMEKLKASGEEHYFRYPYSGCISKRPALATSSCGMSYSTCSLRDR